MNFNPRFSAIARFLSICIASLFVLVTFVLPPGADARSCRVNYIPNGNRFSCTNCHRSAAGGGLRTPFGNLVSNFSGTDCFDDSFWSSVASFDSDGDGRTNGEELGDPSGTWSVGAPRPGNPNRVTNPGVSDTRFFIRMDANGDGTTDLADGMRILQYLFGGATAPACIRAADANGDGSVSISDGHFVLVYLFLSNDIRPPSPFPSCGSVSDDRRLSCEASSICGN